jgi:hypothetical protein
MAFLAPAGGGIVGRWLVAFAGAICCFAGSSALAQEEAEAPPTAERMIEVAREAYRPPGLRRRGCPPPERPGDIVVCAPDHEDHRISSPTQDAIAQGTAVPDGLPRAPDVFGLPPCNGGCISIGSPPPPLYLIDLTAIPEPLPPEEARQILRADPEPAP